MSQKKPRLKRINPKIHEEQRRYLEEILQPEILSANPQKEEIIKEETVKVEFSAPVPKGKKGLRRFFK